MLIDMHVHSKKYSSCSNIDIEDGIRRAQNIGLDGICITDHDNMGIKSEIKSLTNKYKFTILLGIEINTYDGDFLVYGIERIPKNKIGIEELISVVKKQQGVIIAAHPFRTFTGHIDRSIGSKINELAGLHGIEVLNGKTKNANNMKALDVGKKLGITLLGGSDAHEIREIGSYVTYFTDDVKNEKQMVEKIKEGNCYPVIFNLVK